MKKLPLALLALAFSAAPLPARADGSDAAPPVKTLADVADRTVGMLGDLVFQAAHTVQGIAPHFWRIMVRQQRATAIADLIVPWALFAFVVVLKTYVRRRIPGKDDEFNRVAFTVVFPAFAMFGFVIWGLNELSDSAMLLINPYYYAARDILVMLLAPGQMGSGS